MRPIYPERESRNLEFKSQLPNFHNLIKTCVAFANGTGGIIVIGVNDKTREIIGITDAIRNRIYDELPNSLYDATSPSLLVEIYEKRFDDISIMIIDVPASIKKPVFIKNEGIPKGVYLRAGSNTRRASSEYVEELMRENKRVHFDEEPIQTDIDILSPALLKSAFQKIDPGRLITEKVITRAGNHTQKLHPTVGGVLAFCEMPEIYIPEAMIHCTRFAGVDGRNIIQSEAIQGHLEKQIDNSFSLVKAWLMRDYQLFGAKLKGKSIIPEIALREAIINAAIHRKYWIPGAIKIALYDNRLEIFNPGNFPGLFDLNNLGDGTTYLRNPHLARIARRIGLVEKLGTGIRLMFETCAQAGIAKPVFLEGADSVKVIFSFLPAEKIHSSDEEKLLEFFKTRKEAKLAEVEHYLRASRNTATRRLNLLIKSGKIRREGRGPAVKFILN